MKLRYGIKIDDELKFIVNGRTYKFSDRAKATIILSIVSLLFIGDGIHSVYGKYQEAKIRKARETSVSDAEEYLNGIDHAREEAWKEFKEKYGIVDENEKKEIPIPKGYLSTISYYDYQDYSTRYNENWYLEEDSYYIPDTYYEDSISYSSSGAVYVSDYEFYSLCNLVAGEYGSEYISVYDKGAVVATVIHRYWDGGWVAPDVENSIINVITAPNQYDGAYCAMGYTENVTDSCIAAVEYALNNMDAYEYYYDPQGESHYWITSFYGDGKFNYFK